MSSGRNTPGASRLAGVLDKRIKDSQSGEKLLDFAEIQGDGSLLCNTYPCPIPKADYTVCRSLAQDDSETVTTSGADGHTHSVNIARAQEEKLKPGDRVLVAWVGNDAVVIDIILSGDAVL